MATLPRTPLLLVVVACSAGRPVPPADCVPEAGGTLVAQPTPALQEPPSARPLPPPLLEDETGVAGAPRDETAFEFDVEEMEDFEVDVPPLLDGVPTLSRAATTGIGPFLQTRRASVAGLSNDGQSMLVLTNLGETTQVHLLKKPLGARQQLTFGSEPVTQVAFVPGGANILTLRRDYGGNEDYQVFRLDMSQRRTTRLSDGFSRHGPFRASAKGDVLAVASNARNGVDMDIVLLDPNGWREPRTLVQTSGQWIVQAFSRDGSKLLAREVRSANESTLHLIDVSTGAAAPLAPLMPDVSYGWAQFHPSRDAVLVKSDRGGDFVSIYEHDLRDGWDELTPGLGWDVDEAALSGDGTRLAFSVNEEGYSKLFLLDSRSQQHRELPGVPPGVISGLRFAGHSDKLAFTLSTPTEPSDAYAYEIASRKLVRWTESEVGGLPKGAFIEPELVSVESFDGERISTFVYLPRRPGPHPVLLWMHGGPEDQSRPRFEPIIQYFAASRGIAVVVPNVRGSTGYGKRFRGLDDTIRRVDAVRDVGALLDWIDADIRLDAERIGIHGASYGGYMVLASLVEYGRRIKAGSDLVGISNLVTFLERTRAYRQALRRQEYGDERDPQVRRVLEAMSPDNHAHRIESALLVAHGANDPRVPVAEAERIVRRVRQHGGDAWLFVAPNEGHSLRKRRNRDQFYRVMAGFFERYLLDAPKEEPASSVSD